MSEKHLTELPWKTLTIKKQIKDGELTKALVAFGKINEKDASERLKSLDKILTTAEVVKRTNKDDKEVVTYLDEILKEARKEKALAAAATAKAVPKDPTEAKAADAEEDDEEAVDDEAEEYKKNYKSKLTSALAQVRSRAPKPGEETVTQQLKFLAMLSGKGSSVLVANNVGGAARKVLGSLAGGGNGTFVSGQCIFEKNAHTFIVQTIPGGLASKLSKALRAQTGTGYKVRVRTPDGSVVLDDETDVDPDDAPAAEAEKDGQREGESYQDYLDRHDYEQMHAGLFEDLTVMLRENLGDATKMRAVMAFAQEKSAAGNFKSAVQALKALQKLIETAVGGAGAGGQISGEPFSKVAFEKVHLQWDSGKKVVEARLDALKKAIIEDWEDPTAATAADNLKKVLARFNEGLGDTIDALGNSADAKQRSQLATKATAILEGYLSYLGSDPLVAHVESNPFGIAMQIGETLGAPLEDLRSQLGRVPTAA